MRNIVVIAFILALTSVGMVLSAGVNPNAPEYDAWKQQQVNTPEVLAKPSQPSTSFSNFKNDSRDCPLLVPWIAHSRLPCLPTMMDPPLTFLYPSPSHSMV